jgi:hypothetical protein
MTLVLSLALAPIQAATAAEIEGVRFSDRFENSRGTLELHSVGLLRYRVLFKGYVAALYLANGTAADQVLGDVPKRLELSYFWSISGEDFGPAANTVLERSLAANLFARLKERLDGLHRQYRDVKPGDRYALTYWPGSGTSLDLNGAPIATVPGADFASAYFGIWLGDEPLDASLRDQLLKRD